MNELITEYALADGNSRWPVVNIRDQNIPAENIHNVALIKQFNVTKGYMPNNFYGTPLSSLASFKLNKSKLNKKYLMINTTKAASQNSIQSQLLSKIFVYYEGK